MADEYVHDLSAIGAVDAGSLLAIEDTASPTDLKKVTVADLQTFLNIGSTFTDDISIPSNKLFHFNGIAGNTYMKWNSNDDDLEFWIAGIKEGYFESTGLVVTNDLTVGDNVNISAGKNLNLEGAAGDTRITFDTGTAQERHFINNTLEAYFHATGLHVTNDISAGGNLSGVDINMSGEYKMDSDTIIDTNQNINITGEYKMAGTTLIGTDRGFAGNAAVPDGSSFGFEGMAGDTKISFDQGTDQLRFTIQNVIEAYINTGGLFVTNDMDAGGAYKMDGTDVIGSGRKLVIGSAPVGGSWTLTSNMVMLGAYTWAFANDIAVPDGKKIHLEGIAGDTYILFDGGTDQIRFYLHGILEGYIDSDGFSGGGQLTTEEVQDIVGGMVTGNTETGIAVTYQDGDGTLDFVVSVHPPAAHGATHQNNQADEFTLTGLTGLLVTPQTPVSHNNTYHSTNYATETNFNNHVGAGGGVHADVIAAGADGFMTGSDKTKLNTIATGADVTGSNAPQAHAHTHASTTGRTVNDHHSKSHGALHQNGQVDEFTLTGLTGLLATPQTPASHAYNVHTGNVPTNDLAGLSQEDIVTDGGTKKCGFVNGLLMTYVNN